MNSWRPDGWDAEDIYATTEWIGMEQTDLVEAGADALLTNLIDCGIIKASQLEDYDAKNNKGNT